MSLHQCLQLPHHCQRPSKVCRIHHLQLVQLPLLLQVCQLEAQVLRRWQRHTHNTQGHRTQQETQGEAGREYGLVRQEGKESVGRNGGYMKATTRFLS